VGFTNKRFLKRQIPINCRNTTKNEVVQAYCLTLRKFKNSIQYTNIKEPMEVKAIVE